MIILIATAAAAIAAVAAGAWWTWRKVNRMLDFEYQAGYRLGRHDQYMWHEHCRTAIAATEPPAIEGPSDPIDPDGWEDQGDDAAEATAYFQALIADPADTVPDPEPASEELDPALPVLTVPAVIEIEWERIQRENDRLAQTYSQELTDSFAAIRKNIIR